MGLNQLKIPSVFIALGGNILTNKEIRDHLKTGGRSIGGILSGLAAKQKDWIVRKHPSGGWQFNKKHREKVLDTIKKFDI